VSWWQFRRRAPARPRLNTLFFWTWVANLVRFWMSCAYRMRTSGAEHVPREGPAIFAPNHQSHLDPMIVGVLVRDRPFASLARASLFDRRLFGGLISALGAVPLERGRADTGALRNALRALADGRTLLFFPEGTRTEDGRVQRLRDGVAFVAERADVPIIPVAIEGARDVWPRGRSRPRWRGWIAVRAGPPLRPSELVDEEGRRDLEVLRRRLEAVRLELRAELRAASRGRWPPAGPGDRPYWEAPDLTPPASGSSPST
jgi:1-acyl-sn-glycerol-3-phosphate acyltransferase